MKTRNISLFKNLSATSTERKKITYLIMTFENILSLQLYNNKGYRKI